MKPINRPILVIATSAALLSTAAPPVGALVAARYCLGKRATIVGTAGPDRLNGTAGADVIVGRGGQDHIGARGGNDRVCGGVGGDNLVGGKGDDRIKAGPGNDSLSGRTGNDVLNGGAGFADAAKFRLATRAVTASLVTDSASGEGSDTLTGIEQLWGSNLGDTLTGDDGAGGNYLIGARGDDTLDGGDGADRVDGGLGDDTLDGGPGTDFLSFLASSTPVTVDLEAGTSSGEGTDTATDFEVVFGSPYDDVLDGSNGDNFLLGQGGNDVIRGFAGSDHLEGGVGTDDLDGGPGNDSCLEGETLVNCE